MKRSIHQTIDIIGDGIALLGFLSEDKYYGVQFGSVDGQHIRFFVKKSFVKTFFGFGDYKAVYELVDPQALMRTQAVAAQEWVKDKTTMNQIASLLLQHGKQIYQFDDFAELSAWLNENPLKNWPAYVNTTGNWKMF